MEPLLVLYYILISHSLKLGASWDALGCSVMFHSHLCCGEARGVSVWGQQSVPSLLLLRLFRSWSKGCGEEQVLNVSLWCSTLWGGGCWACLCWFSVKFLCGEEISSRWMKGFQTQLGLGGGKKAKGDTCIQKFAFVMGEVLENVSYP